ncbi:hypothetical protein WJX73_008243 [Symbiochloris irregularis]|uniref:Uncharacterized protein n=1 Tax=Symbiochloris irregularis TaxID=706552 RepID=A0AAW1NSH8_9CHLO
MAPFFSDWPKKQAQNGRRSCENVNVNVIDLTGSKAGSENSGIEVAQTLVWKAKGAMIHDGKVVVDKQGRVMGRNGKLLKDKEGNYVYMKAKDAKKDAKKVEDAADSGETHRKNGKQQKKVSSTSPPCVRSTSPSRVPFSKKNAAPAGDKPGMWSADELAAWSSATNNGKENTVTRR